MSFLPKPITSAHIPYLTVMNIPAESTFYCKSFAIEAVANAWTIHDIGIMNDLTGPLGICYFAGGLFKTRTSWPEGSELNVQIVDRDDMLGYFGYYGMSRAKLANLTSISGTFVVGEHVKGGTSNCCAKILAVGSDYLEITHARWDDTTEKVSNFTDGETLTGETSGATATADTPAFTEGNALFLQHMVRDEDLEGQEESVFQPGGAEPLTEGLYMRIKMWNPAPSTVHRIKIRFEMGLL